MKSNRNFSTKGDTFAGDDLLRKATKLEPIKKSGKEKRTIYSDLESEDEIDLLTIKKRESILDYFGDDDEDDRETDDEWEEDDEEGDDDEFDDDEEGDDDESDDDEEGDDEFDEDEEENDEDK